MQQLSNRTYFLLSLALATLFAFWKLGDASLLSWDEAYYGSTALEMLLNKDYVNNYYLGQPDTINVKPPLMYWLICISYKLFGYNEFAMRLPSALAAIGFIVIVFKLVTLYRPGRFAFMVCLMLFSGKGLFGPHVARTGDTDMLLTFWISLLVFGFIQYVNKQNVKYALLCGISIGLAFWTKSTASFLIIPGLLIYLLLTKKLTTVLKSPYIYISITIFVVSILLWIIMLESYGNKFVDSEQGGENAWQTTIIFDTLKRFFSSDFEHGSANKWSYIFVYLDAKLIGWNYLFYLIAIVSVAKLLKSKTYYNNLVSKPQNQLIVLSISLIVAYSLVLTLANNKHGWYMAPVLLYFCIITIEGLYQFKHKHKAILPITFMALLFTASIHFYSLNNPKTAVKDFFIENIEVLTQANKIYFLQYPEPKYVLYTQWLNQNFEHIENINSNLSGVLIGGSNTVYTQAPHLNKIDCINSACIYSIK